MGNKTEKRKPKIFLAISYTERGKVENAITNFFRDKGFDVITGRKGASGEHIDKAIKNVIEDCDFGVVVYNELRHNVTYEWGLLDALGKKVFPLKDGNVHINLKEEFSDKNGVKLTPFCGADSEEEIKKSLMDDEGLTAAIEKAVRRAISESPEQPEVKEAAKVVVTSEMPLGTIPVVQKEIPDVDRVISALSKIPKLTADGYFYRGNAYCFIMEYDKAIKDYNKALKLNPNNAEAYNNRGVAYIDKGEYYRAIKDFDQAIKLDPNYAEAYNNRGIVYDHKAVYDNAIGEYDNAIKDFDQAIKLDPNYAEAYCNRGGIYSDKGEHDRAIEDYNKALKLNPNFAEVYDNRGIAYRQKGEYDRAIEDFDQALKLNPNIAAAYSNRGVAYSGKGEHDKALEDFNKSLKLKYFY